jgi:hypothetical protein
MAGDKFRPFGILKRIRDKKPKVGDLVGPSSGPNLKFDRFITGLQALDLVSVDDDGRIKTTKTLSLLQNTLGLSLTDLDNYSPYDSMICSPIFGLPRNKLEKADIFMVMPFLKKLKPVYDDHIRTVVKKLNCSIARGDDFLPQGQ